MPDVLYVHVDDESELSEPVREGEVRPGPGGGGRDGVGVHQRRKCFVKKARKKLFAEIFFILVMLQPEKRRFGDPREQKFRTLKSFKKNTCFFRVNIFGVIPNMKSAFTSVRLRLG